VSPPSPRNGAGSAMRQLPLSRQAIDESVNRSSEYFEDTMRNPCSSACFVQKCMFTPCCFARMERTVVDPAEEETG